MLFPLHVECAKQETLKTLNHISFFRDQSRRISFRCAKQETLQQQSTQCAPPAWLRKEANGKTWSTASSEREKKKWRSSSLLQSSPETPAARFGYVHISEIEVRREFCKSINALLAGNGYQSGYHLFQVSETGNLSHLSHDHNNLT